MDQMEHQFDRWVRIIASVLVLALVLLCALLFEQYQELRHADLMSAHALWLHRVSAGQSLDPNSIQSWMTYDYINHIYGLPTSYLQTTLNLADTRYPRVSITESAEAQKLTAAELTAEVKTAVGDYLTKSGA